jgi:hypothetical protein
MKTTKKDNELFKGEFLLWRERLGLTDWRVRFYHEQLKHPLAGCIAADLEARLVGVYLGFTVDHRIEELARHEALELLVSELDTLARDRHVRPEEITAARHAVIRRLENLLDAMEG